MSRIRRDLFKQIIPENPLKKWRSQFDSNSLQPSDFLQYFHELPPNFFEIQLSTELGKCSFDEAKAKVLLLDVLEEFIWGDNPQLLLEKLKTEDNYPSVCGRVFKLGEPTYSCRECGMDPTCVLCVNCFKQSAHKNHKYKMSTSSGGGCCDCGDNEAWKKDPYCDEHILGTEKHDESSVITDRIKNRCCIVFHALMQYCAKSLEIESDASMLGLDGDTEDIYCTVLYNDETHTFEQVIQTLTRIVGCSQKDAVEYVTSIDREGRAVVKCSTFQNCAKLKEEIEKQGTRYANASNKPSPLNVAVLHKKAVAYQYFALQLLGWFQDFLTIHATFRKIFCDVATQDTNYNINHILLNDSKLWKTARASWHRLLISGMLMEYDNKKALSIIFTKNYTNIMQDFIRDDHEHSFSVVSLSVQLFTVPTIAHHLIANDSAFFKLMHTFYSECIEKYVLKKILQFTKNATNMNLFKRASYILFDLKYLLNFKPDVWTDDLRRGFLHGVQILIRLLQVMQGMDAVQRQTGQHMEYEPEWESAFNLHIKLANIITLVLDWCSSDQIVLVKVYRMILASLTESDFIVSETVNELKELADHSASCLMYDVSLKPVSVHLPLSRFFAGLYLHLEKFNLSFDTITINNSIKPTPEQIIEPVLCTQTMIAQVHSGLWRRNGYSLLNQLYFYRNVKCRSEMLDRDITVLQIGASLIESNEFMIHIINKFNLINWISADYEKDSSATTTQGQDTENIIQIINMVDEFLEILIVLIGERYVPGVGLVTEEDKIKKEIIQQLSIKPLSHSELNRTLPDTQQDGNGIDNVINSVAAFQKSTPQSDKKRYYELKPEYYDCYNMYFYHYSREDKSKSEEAQRNRKKMNNERVCCPPPKLPKLSESFHMIANLLQCDVMLLVMETVLKRALNLKAKSFSESHLQKVLHLIGYAIQEQESENYPFLTFHDRAAKWGILQLMEELMTSPRVEAHRDLIAWTIGKYKEVQSSDDKNVAVKTTNEQQSNEGASTNVPPLNPIEQATKEERAKLAAERRAKILAQMAKAQNKFLSANIDLFETTKQPSDTSKTSGACGDPEMDWQGGDAASTTTAVDKTIACLGPHKKNHNVLSTEIAYKCCILCSEDAIISKDGPCMVYSAFIQKSSVLSRYQKTNDQGQLQYLETAIHPSPHTGTCGHVMHASCWQEYFNNEVIKETRRPYRNRSPGTFDVEKKEFLCPLCRCISNGVLPVTPELWSFTTTTTSTQNNNEIITFDIWIEIMKAYTSVKNSNDDMNIITDDKIEKITRRSDMDDSKSLEHILEKFNLNLKQFYKICEPQTELIGSELREYIQSFMDSVRRVVPFPTAEEIEPFQVTWLSCAYTIESLEMLLRALDKPLKDQLSIRHQCCLSGMIRLCGLLGLSSSTTTTTTTDDNRIEPKLVQHMRDLYDTVFSIKGMSVLQWDVFGILISLLYITPITIYADQNKFAIPKGDYLEYYILKLMFLANMSRIVTVYELNNDDSGDIKMDIDIGGIFDDSTIDDDEFNNDVTETNVNDNVVDNKNDTSTDDLLEFYNNYNLYTSENNRTNKKPLIITSKLLIEEIKKQSETFLRCACLLFHFMTDIELPEQFSIINGDTFELMCDYLGLNSNVETYFQNTVMKEFMSQLVTHPDIINLKKSFQTNTNDLDQTIPFMSSVPPIRQLVALPDDYSDLINGVSLFTCPNNDRDDSRNPTMCLICGEILCSQTYCCQKEINKVSVGACTYHAHICGAGVGMFLRIRECEILLLGLNKGCFVLPPYLDEYGETDQGLRRGNPLTLSKERYKKLHLMWLGHGLYEEIARSNESTSTIVATQWQHL